MCKSTNETHRHCHWLVLNFSIGHYILSIMDSNTSSFLLNSSTFHSVFYQDKQDDGIIDLGLSLGSVQHDAYHSSANCMNSSPFVHCFQFFSSFSYMNEWISLSLDTIFNHMCNYRNGYYWNDFNDLTLMTYWKLWTKCLIFIQYFVRYFYDKNNHSAVTWISRLSLEDLFYIKLLN
jgi:hypothetical protein